MKVFDWDEKGFALLAVCKLGMAELEFETGKNSSSWNQYYFPTKKSFLPGLKTQLKDVLPASSLENHYLAFQSS